MRKQEQVKKIIQQLLKYGRVKDYTKNDLNVAITKALWLNDERSFKRWRDLLFNLGFLVQSNFEVYALNFERLAELEVIDGEQRKLFNI